MITAIKVAIVLFVSLFSLLAGGSSSTFGLFGLLAIVTVLYVAVAFVVTGMVKYTDLATTTTPSGAPDRKTLATAFAANDIDWAANIISIGALAVPVVPVLAILACLWLMLNLTVLTWLRFVIWMVVGVVVYFAYSRRHPLLGQRMADQPH